jgi:hypothetical protein
MYIGTFIHKCDVQESIVLKKKLYFPYVQSILDYIPFGYISHLSRRYPYFLKCHLVPVPAYTYRIYRVQIQREVISDLKRENQFLSKETWESI